ncbi:MAG: hypothetical protein ACI378_00090 [Bacteroides sp.]
MKTKILFGALMGTFALAACNSEEEFTTPAQKTSPITFEVTLDGADAATKAEFASGKINFELGDLLSLYHGITDASSASTGFTGYSNAVYEAKACGDGEALKFVSAAMVNKGEAVMIWPADTTFANTGTAAPNITIPAVQDAKTKLLMPYVSEVLTIDAYDGEEMKNVAGYNKTYPVVLKQFGSTLTLNTKAINDDVISNLDVAALKVTDVELTAKSATANLFNTSVALKATGATPHTNTDDFDHWADVTEADFTSATASATLKTTDATNTSAIFTLLPVASTADVADAADKAKVVINTNYGTVTVAYASGETPWAKTEDKLGTTEAKTVSDGLEDVLKNVYIDNTTTSSKFYGEKTGGKMTRWIEADISKLDMNNLHIKDAEQLIDVLKVLDAMKEVAGSTVATAAAINFYLDGDAEGVFTMTPAAAAAYTAHLDATAPAITFTPCATAGEACTAVKFVAESETEVPTKLAFETNSVNVQLAGTWKWSADDKDYNAQVNNIVVLEDATLNLSNTVKAGTANTIINNGTVNVSGITYLETVKLRNLGTITIPENAEFRVKSALANRATTLEAYGKIYNSGVLATVGTSGAIYNYGGYIKQVVNGAKTYITSNETGTGFAAAFKSDATPNLIGTIELFDKDDDNYSVSNSANQGFIMITTTAAAVAAEDLGEEANYVKLAGDCTSFTYSQTSATARLQYVEIASSKEVVWTSASTENMKGVIVPEGKKLNIKKSNTVKSAATFVKGTIYQGGAYTPGVFVTYFGGENADAANIITY